jgi:hypothetical protein
VVPHQEHRFYSTLGNSGPLTKSGGHRGETVAPISAASFGFGGMGGADGLNSSNSGLRFSFPA